MKNEIPQHIEYLNNQFYEPCGLILSDFSMELEGKEYQACTFKLNEAFILCRNAKTTPKKTGQFVTCWKRNQQGITEPFHENDVLDFYIINTFHQDKMGQFIFPKPILIEKGIIATTQKEGKRGFRVYPPWDITTNKQAEKTQKWQLDYFIEFNNFTNLKSFQEILG